MKSKNFFAVVVIFLITSFLIMAGCTVPTDKNVSSVSTIIVSRVSPTQTPQPATQLPSVTPNATLTPTSTNTVQPTTPMPTHTVSPTDTKTPIAIPTVADMGVTQQVLWLFETNNGCQLPCWWGITPGQTEWVLAEEFFNSFSGSIYKSSLTPGLMFYEPTIPLPTEVFAEDQMNLGILVRNGIVEFINTRVSMGNTPPGYLSNYTLSALLATYGQPAEVRVFTYESPFENSDLPFSVVLFYPDQGIAALFIDNGTREGDMVSGCPQQGPASYLSLWYPALDLTFEDVQSGSAVYNVDFLTLEESTEMSVTTFYETFKNSDNTTCLETPAALWR